MADLTKIGVAVYVFLLVVVCYRWLAWADERRQSYPNYPRLSEQAGPICLMTFAFTCGQWCVRFVMHPLACSLIVHKAKWSDTVYQAKLKRFGNAVFKGLFFTLFAAYSYSYVLQNASWFPEAFGGSGETKNCFGVGNAGDTQPLPDKYFLYFYLIAIAYHFSELIFQVVFELEKPDFAEMMLHHSTTCFLLFASFYMNFMRIGSIVLFVHDISDIPIYSAKIFVDTNFKITTFVCLLGMLSSWGYFRLYGLPAQIIRSVWYETGEELKIQGVGVCIGFAGLLGVLWCLHVFWYSKFLQMGWGFLTKFETTDTQANLKAMGEKKGNSKRE